MSLLLGEKLHRIETAERAATWWRADVAAAEVDEQIAALCASTGLAREGLSVASLQLTDTATDDMVALHDALVLAERIGARTRGCPLADRNAKAAEVPGANGSGAAGGAKSALTLLKGKQAGARR